MTYFRNSLRNKLVLFLLAAIIIPISLSIFVTYQYTKENVKQAYLDSNKTLLYQGASNLINYLERINQTTLMVYQDNRSSRSLYKIVEKETLQHTDEQEIYVAFQFMSNSLSELKQIYLYMDKSDVSYRFANSLPRYMKGQTFAPQFQVGRDFYIQSAHRSHDYGIAKYSFELPEDVITIHRKILNQPSDQTLGTLSFDIKLSKINGINQMLYQSGEEQLYLINEDGSILYSSDFNVTDEQTTQWLAEVKQQLNPSGYLEHKEQNFNGIHLFQTLETPFAELLLIKRIPGSLMSKNATQLTLINSSIMLACLIIAAAATVYISFHFTSPMKKLIRYINQIESGQLEANLDTKRTDEIGILSRRFYQLIQRLNQLINKEYKLELANKTNQLKALQAQVQPHFMNNALQSIGTLALQHDERKIYGLISALGKMMRYQMNTNEVLVPLSAELDYVRAYLNLQAQRFEDKFVFRIDVDEQTKHIEVPKMILQPIAENCFKHGFIQQNNEGKIIIAAELTQQSGISILAIHLEDNGVGVSSKQLEALQFQLDHLHADSTGGDSGIGLSNVQSRLRLYFNDQAGMRLKTIEPHGLKVTLLIPLPENQMT